MSFGIVENGVPVPTAGIPKYMEAKNISYADGNVEGALNQLSETKADKTELPTVYDWAKAPTKPSYAFSEITGSPVIRSGGSCSLNGSVNLTGKTWSIAFIVFYCNSYFASTMFIIKGSNSGRYRCGSASGTLTGYLVQYDGNNTFSFSEAQVNNTSQSATMTVYYM